MAENTLRIPTHVGIIMDGNGRWARERGLPRVEGHRAGAAVVKDIVEGAQKLGIRYLSLYTFSTENWKRPMSEVLALFGILDEYLQKEVPRMLENDIRLRIAGRWKELPGFVVSRLLWAIEETRRGKGMDLVLCLNYGGRVEILDAINALLGQGVREVDEDAFRGYLYLPDLPDLDLVIRTSGEKRISNFLLWQISYAELYFTPVLWPDFTVSELKEALEEYGRRQRRFGGIANV